MDLKTTILRFCGRMASTRNPSRRTCWRPTKRLWPIASPATAFYCITLDTDPKSRTTIGAKKKMDTMRSWSHSITKRPASVTTTCMISLSKEFPKNQRIEVENDGRQDSEEIESTAAGSRGCRVIDNNNRHKIKRYITVTTYLLHSTTTDRCNVLLCFILCLNAYFLSFPCERTLLCSSVLFQASCTVYVHLVILCTYT
jgi:hypothetical protein